MISAWRKLINKNDHGNDINANGVPPGVQKLDKELQRKFARGVNYNMRVVIRGDAKVGKSSLFARLRGQPFDSRYEPTETLNVTSIDWNYKATDDIVKIDLWEAIDSSSKKPVNFVDLKRANNSIPDYMQSSLAELSENFDIYNKTDAVLLIMDMTKNWTFKFIQSELPKIPKHIPVLVIANFRDQGHHRTVTSDQVKSLLEGQDRSTCDGLIMYTEASMKDGFGMKLIEKFLNIPFLKIQEAALLKHIELNRSDYLATWEELQAMQETSNQAYETYLEVQTIMRRQRADAMSPVNAGIKKLDETTREQIRQSKVSSCDADKLDYTGAKSIESNNNTDKKPTEAQALANQKFVNDRLASIVIGAKNPLPQSKTVNLGQEQSATVVANVDEPSEDSDDDEDETPKANPLVAGYQSDLDPDDLRQ